MTSTWSLPVRGAWIEMLSVVVLMLGRMCRSPCGERGLKYAQRHQAHPSAWRRSPCGERGLKYPPLCYHFSRRKSLPVRGAWIEIGKAARLAHQPSSLPVRGAWIEIVRSCRALYPRQSLPVRGAWIEIDCTCPWRLRKCRRSPCGERGLKCALDFPLRVSNHGRSPCGERGLKCALDFPLRVSNHGRSPCGERGLKFRVCAYCHVSAASLPVRGAWIEIRPRQ